MKQKRKERAGKYVVPLPKVQPISEAEMFKVIKTGKRQSTILSSELRLTICREVLEANGNQGHLCW